jgi:hypothetical protein
MKCLEKRRYPLIELANKAVTKLKNTLGVQNYVYRCKECDGYHLTTMHPRLVRKIKTKKK